MYNTKSFSQESVEMRIPIYFVDTNISSLLIPIMLCRLGWWHVVSDIMTEAVLETIDLQMTLGCSCVFLSPLDTLLSRCSHLSKP